MTELQLKQTPWLLTLEKGSKTYGIGLYIQNTKNEDTAMITGELEDLQRLGELITQITRKVEKV